MSITGKSGTRAIASRYPNTDGLTSETTSQEGHKETLEPQKGSKIPERYKKGIR